MSKKFIGLLAFLFIVLVASCGYAEVTDTLGGQNSSGVYFFTMDEDGVLSGPGSIEPTGYLVAEGGLDIGTVETFTESDTSPDVTKGSYFISGSIGLTIVDFSGSGIVDGQIIVVESATDLTFDVTSSGLKGGTTNLVTADGDLTTWLYNGTDWILQSFIDQSDNLN